MFIIGIRLSAVMEVGEECSGRLLIAGAFGGEQAWQSERRAGHEQTSCHPTANQQGKLAAPER